MAEMIRFSRFGYCHSQNMPCNCGICSGRRVRGTVTTTAIMFPAFLDLIKSYKKKGMYD